LIEELLDYHQGHKPKTEIRGRRQMLATGFASPADRFVEKRLNINDLVVKNPTATFFFKVKSDLHAKAPFLHGDILIVDRSTKPIHDSYAIATANGEFVLVHIVREHQRLIGKDLRTLNKIVDEWSAWGVISYYIRPTL